MIRLYRWSRQTRSGVWLDPTELSRNAEELRNSGDILWIDMQVASDEEETLVFEQFLPIHALSLEDVKHLKRKPDVPPHFPKVEEFPDYLFVIVNPLVNRLLENIEIVSHENSELFFEDGSPVTQLSAVITANVLVTHHYEQMHAVDVLREYVERHSSAAARGPDYLFHLILDDMVDEYAPVLDHFSESLDQYESKMFDKPSRKMLKKLIHCKRAIVVLRKTLIYEREILARLSRGEFELIDEREMVYYRNVYDHLLRFAELIEASRETVGDLLQMHLAASSNRLNEVMKVLAMISTTVLPMTLIAGVYGMNFQRLVPDTSTEYGFEIALGMMLASGLASLIYFRWRKWF